MIPRDILHNILQSGAEAPSGENAQPWRFEIRGDEVFLWNIPERDVSLYNFRERASHIAHGAVIENIFIAAAHFGYSTKIDLFPEKDQKLVARISFQEGAAKGGDLYPWIGKRMTNRKPYSDKKIPPQTIGALVSLAPSNSSITIKFISDETAIREIASAASVNDRLLLENKSIHSFFFAHVHWTLKEEEEKRLGFYIEVLELPPPAKALFRLFRHWSVMRFLNALGVAKAGAKQNIATYATAAAVGTITIPATDPAAFVEAGRAFQRVWLEATKEGIALQPLTGILFFHQRIAEEGGEVFSSEHRAAIEAAYTKVRSIFDVSEDTIAMMFRVGYGDSPTAHSLKMPPSISERK